MLKIGVISIWCQPFPWISGNFYHLIITLPSFVLSIQLQKFHSLKKSNFIFIKDDEFNRVLRLSEEEYEQRRRNQLEQDEELERVLQLSLIEK